MAKRFDRKREDDYFRDLTVLRQFGSVDEFVAKFQRLAVLTHHLLEERLVFIFVEGLTKLLRGMVKVSSSGSLDDVIWATYDLEPTVKSLRRGSVSKGPTNQKLYSKVPRKAKTATPQSKLD